MITESLGLMLLGPAVSLLREATLRASWESGAIRTPKAVAATAAIADRQSRGAASGASGDA